MSLPNPQPVAFATWEAPVLQLKMKPAISVAGWTFILNVQNKLDVLVLQSSTYSVVDVVNGVVNFPVTSVQSGAIGSGDFDFDIWRIDSGSEKRLAWGPLSLAREQWKP